MTSVTPLDPQDARGTAETVDVPTGDFLGARFCFLGRFSFSDVFSSGAKVGFVPETPIVSSASKWSPEQPLDKGAGAFFNGSKFTFLQVAMAFTDLTIPDG